MRNSVLINNYNYGRYLEEAVQSVLSQSIQADEIIIVDDGSTDNLLLTIQEKFSHFSQIKFLIKRENEGQLSCFNQGFINSTGDLIFFLDADDTYKENYIEECVKFFKDHESCDFLFCAHEEFGSSHTSFYPYTGDRDLGYSLIITLFQQEWIGSITSTISMRRSLLSKILPLPYLEDWKVRADDCLVWGASIAGARKYYLSQCLVNYRVHSDNLYNSQTNKFNSFYFYKRSLSIHRLFYFLLQKQGYDHLQIYQLAHEEFKTLNSPSVRYLWQYLKIALFYQSDPLKKIRSSLQMIKHFINTRI